MKNQIKCAVRARVMDFDEQADSLTLEGVRRILEEDMGLRRFELDSYKTFIMQCLTECFDSIDNENGSKNSKENIQRTVPTVKEETISCEKLQPRREVSRPSSGDEENMEKSRGSVIKGISEHETEGTQGSISQSVPSKDTIKKAIKQRTSYFRANFEKITLSAVRRLLEDLKLEKNALDVHKFFINEQFDKVLLVPDADPGKEVRKRSAKKAYNLCSNGPIKVRNGNGNAFLSDSNASTSSDRKIDEEKVQPKKRTAQKEKVKKIKSSKKPKRSSDEIKSASSGKSKHVELILEISSDSDAGGNVSEDDIPQPSAEVNVKWRKETSTSSYGKCVGHLKLIIKSCGMSVPPSIYKKANQAPESKQEAYLLKELEEILRREGLSMNPSEKEIRKFKREKERAKELDVIDMNNIVSSSRRRSTSNFMTPPKPMVPVESDEDGGEGDTNDDTDDDSGSEDESDGCSEDMR